MKGTEKWADEYVEQHYRDTHPLGDSHRLAAKMGFEAGLKTMRERVAKFIEEMGVSDLGREGVKAIGLARLIRGIGEGDTNDRGEY